MERVDSRPSAGGLDRSLPVLLQGTEGNGHWRLYQDSQRRPRHRAPHEPGVLGRSPRGRFGVNRFVGLVATAPAKLFGLYPRKGTIAVGGDADLVIFDPKREHAVGAKTHHMRVDYSMFGHRGDRHAGRHALPRARPGRKRKFLGRLGQGEFIKEEPAPRSSKKSCHPTGASAGSRVEDLFLELTPEALRLRLCRVATDMRGEDDLGSLSPRTGASAPLAALAPAGMTSF